MLADSSAAALDTFSDGGSAVCSTLTEPSQAFISPSHTFVSPSQKEATVKQLSPSDWKPYPYPLTHPVETGFALSFWTVKSQTRKF